LPYLLQAAGTFAANYIVQQGVTNSAAAVFSGIKMVLSTLGQGFATVFSYFPFFGQSIALNATLAPELISLSALAGLATSTIGVPASNAVERFKKYWYTPTSGTLFATNVITSPMNEYVGGGSYGQIKSKLPALFFSPRSSSHYDPVDPLVTARSVKLKLKHSKDKDYIPDSDPEDDYSDSQSFGYSR
jgi:hypothetical protein